MVFGVLSDGSKQFTISLGGQIFLIRMHMGLHQRGKTTHRIAILQSQIIGWGENLLVRFWKALGRVICDSKFGADGVKQAGRPQKTALIRCRRYRIVFLVFLADDLFQAIGIFFGRNEFARYRVQFADAFPTTPCLFFSFIPIPIHIHK